jgi:hypothetical protein
VRVCAAGALLAAPACASTQLPAGPDTRPASLRAQQQGQQLAVVTARVRRHASDRVLARPQQLQQLAAAAARWGHGPALCPSVPATSCACPPLKAALGGSGAPQAWPPTHAAAAIQSAQPLCVHCCGASVAAALLRRKPHGSDAAEPCVGRPGARPLSAATAKLICHSPRCQYAAQRPPVPRKACQMGPSSNWRAQLRRRGSCRRLARCVTAAARAGSLRQAREHQALAATTHCLLWRVYQCTTTTLSVPSMHQC